MAQPRPADIRYKTTNLMKLESVETSVVTVEWFLSVILISNLSYFKLKSFPIVIVVHTAYASEGCTQIIKRMQFTLNCDFFKVQNILRCKWLKCSDL